MLQYPRGKSREEARVSTQLVLNKYNTNYEALRLTEIGLSEAGLRSGPKGKGGESGPQG